MYYYIKKSQRYFNSEKYLKKIIDLVNNKKPQQILEIGPGLGYFTKILTTYKYTGIEIDLKNYKFLKKKFNGEFIHKDALNVSLDGDILFGSLPYHIIKRLILKLIGTKFRCGLFIIQRSLFENIIMRKNYYYYILKFFFVVKKHFIIPNICFKPIPKVDGLFIEITKKKLIKQIKPEIICKILYKITRHIRSKLKKNLKTLKYNIDIDIDRRLHELKDYELINLIVNIFRQNY